MYRCGKCGKDNQDHYQFCLGCGEGASSEPRARRPERSQEPNPGDIQCSACGVYNSPNYAFCLSCASALQSSQTSATTFRDFAPRIAYALYIAHQQVTTRPDHHAHVAIIAGAILAAARSLQSGVAPGPTVLGQAAAIAIRDGGLVNEDPLVIAYGQIYDFSQRYGHPTHPRDDAGLAAAANDPELAGRAQALADALRAR